MLSKYNKQNDSFLFIKYLLQSNVNGQAIPNIFFSVNFFICVKGGDDKSAFQKLVDAIKASKSGKTVGVFAKDAYPGPFMTAWKAVLEKEKFTQVNRAPQIILYIPTQMFQL